MKKFTTQHTGLEEIQRQKTPVTMLTGLKLQTKSYKRVTRIKSFIFSFKINY
jgi:hypothetical protein